MRTKHAKFTGTMPILPTIVNPDRSLDIKSERKLIDYCIENRCASVGHLAGASEHYKVAPSDRQKIVETLVEHTAGRVPTFTGVGAITIEETIRNAVNAWKAGIDIIMIASPVFPSMNAKDLLYYYEKVCASIPLPIIMQDTGASSGCFTPEFIANAYDKISNIGYAKIEMGGFLQKAKGIIDLTDDDFQVIGGDGGFQMIHMLRLGVRAFMTGTEAQDLHNEVIYSYTEGNIDHAVDRYYTSLLPYLELYNMAGKYLCKYMLKRRGIVDHDELLYPYDQPMPDKLLLGELEWVLNRIETDTIKEH